MDSGVVIIEGNIGAGKSTFAKNLAESLHGEAIFEPDEETNPYLADYYRDPGRLAFEMQMFLLTKRFLAQKYAQARVRHSGGFVVMDRSYYGDICFANIQRNMGYFSDRDFDVYMRHHADMKSLLEPPAVSIFLEVPVDKCISRISKRMSEKAGRECEASIEPGYLRALADEIEHLAENLNFSTNIIRLDWGNDVSSEEIRQKTDEVAKRILGLKCGVPDFWTGNMGVGK